MTTNDKHKHKHRSIKSMKQVAFVWQRFCTQQTKRCLHLLATLALSSERYVDTGLTLVLLYHHISGNG